MKCWFCPIRFSKRHSCPKLISYRILRRLFLRVLYATRPKNEEELFTQVMSRIEKDSLFNISSDIVSVIEYYIVYFINEFDVS